MIRVKCPLTQVTLTLEDKAWATVTDDVDGVIVAKPEPSICKSTKTGSSAKLNVQFSRLLSDPV